MEAVASPARTALQTVYDNRHAHNVASSPAAKLKGVLKKPAAGPCFEIVAQGIANDPGSLAVNPDEIECGYTIGLRATMRVDLRNTGTQPLCYKIQTSNPKRYSVTPSVSTVRPGDSTSIAIVCAAMADTPSQPSDRFLIKAATPVGDVTDEAAFWKAGPPGPCVSRKLGVVLVEKIVEEEDEYETETEDDTTSSMTMLLPMHQRRAASPAAQTLPIAEHTAVLSDSAVTWSTPGKPNLQHDEDVPERNHGEEARLRARVVSLESALSERDVEMAAVNGSVKDLHAQIEQRDAAMAAMQGQLEQVVSAWRTKLEATRSEAQASKAELIAQLQASQEAVQRERAAYGQLRQQRDDAERKCSKVEKEASLTHSLKQQHWQAIKTAEVLRAEIAALRAAATGDMSAMQEASAAKSSEIAALQTSNAEVNATLKEVKQEVVRLRKQLAEKTSAYEALVKQQEEAEKEPKEETEQVNETVPTATAVGIGAKVLHTDEEQLPPMLAVEDDDDDDEEDEATRLARQQAEAEFQAQIRNVSRKPVMHSPPSGLLK